MCFVNRVLVAFGRKAKNTEDQVEGNRSFYDCKSKIYFPRALYLRILAKEQRNEMKISKVEILLDNFEKLNFHLNEISFVTFASQYAKNEWTNNYKLHCKLIFANFALAFLHTKRSRTICLWILKIFFSPREIIMTLYCTVHCCRAEIPISPFIETIRKSSLVSGRSNHCHLKCSSGK